MSKRTKNEGVPKNKAVQMVDQRNLSRLEACKEKVGNGIKQQQTVRNISTEVNDLCQLCEYQFFMTENKYKRKALNKGSKTVTL